MGRVLTRIFPGGIVYAVPPQTWHRLRGCARAYIKERRRSNARYPRQALPAQGSIEWVVIVVCIAVALIAALVYLSNQMNIKINTVSKTLAGTNVNGANTPS